MKPGFFPFIIFLSSLIIISCNTNYTVNKRRGYFKIDLPEKKYKLFDQPGYPYSFEYPVYANVVRDSVFFGSRPENDWWLNIEFPQFSGKVFVSYKEIGKNKFDSLIDDAYKMSYKQHVTKASSIEPRAFRTDNNVDGIYFTLEGNTATANQFFLTDSTKHFLRAALYFDATPNEDSLSIVNDFLKKDLQYLINSLKWK